MTPAYPQNLPFLGASERKALTGSAFEILPIAISAKNILSPTATAKTRYKSTKAEPPFAPTMYGNFHALPSPMAAPTMDNINPILENLSLATVSLLVHLS